MSASPAHQSQSHAALSPIHQPVPPVSVTPVFSASSPVRHRPSLTPPAPVVMPDPASCPIIPGRETTIAINKGKSGLGLSIVGGSDTLLVCIVCVLSWCENNIDELIRAFLALSKLCIASFIMCEAKGSKICTFSCSTAEWHYQSATFLVASLGRGVGGLPQVTTSTGWHPKETKFCGQIYKEYWINEVGQVTRCGWHPPGVTPEWNQWKWHWWAKKVLSFSEENKCGWHPENWEMVMTEKGRQFFRRKNRGDTLSCHPG